MYFSIAILPCVRINDDDDGDDDDDDDDDKLIAPSDFTRQL